MALDTQAKLLRVLEESEAVRVGGETPYRFNVRIIAATNKDLKSEIAHGRFRKDLYFRLDVIPLHVPPLRDRGQDVDILARYFLERLCERTGKGMKQWGEGALNGFYSYSWPGNVREMRNFIERLIIMSDGETIGADEVRHLLPVSSELSRTPSESEQSVEDELSLRERLNQYEKGLLIRGYRDTGGNVSKLARLLKIDRANLHRKLKAYGIK
jgi:DNA-binding NtrC family response regulator